MLLEIIRAEQTEVVLAARAHEHVSEVSKTNWTVKFVPISQVSIFRQVFAKLYVFFLILSRDLDVAFLRWFYLRNLSIFFIFFIV